MSDTVILRNVEVGLDTDVGHQFVSDCCKAGEGLITDKELAEKYEIDPAGWQSISKDQALGRLIRAERDRRVLNGAAAREMAAKHLVKGPGILDQILTSADASPKHRIEAHKELRATAAIGSSAEGRPDTEKFIIHIDLGGGHAIHHEFDQPIKPDAPAEDSPNKLIPSKGKYDDDDRW